MMDVDYKKFVKESKDRIGKDKRYFVSSSKIRNNLVWKDNITLEDGIENTINWVNKKFISLKKTNLNYKHII